MPEVTSGIVTLLTDFGVEQPFVGVMKGVIYGRFPAARIVDLAHGIQPQNVAEGSFWLERSYEWFPSGTVHLAVVDPGVGGERAALVAESGGHAFVGPDNGLFGFLPADAEYRRVDARKLGIPEPSNTFHGRDVFAPVAAELASAKLGFDAVGPKHTPAAAPALGRAKANGDRVQGEVVAIDRFGNLITNIEQSLLKGWRSPRVKIGKMERALERTYSDGAAGEYVAVINAFGTVEIARRNGHAAESLELGRGAPVTVEGK